MIHSKQKVRLALDLACPWCYDQYLVVLFSNSASFEHHGVFVTLVAAAATVFRKLLDLPCHRVPRSIVVSTDSPSSVSGDLAVGSGIELVVSPCLACIDHAAVRYASVTSGAAVAYYERASPFLNQSHIFGMVALALVRFHALIIGDMPADMPGCPPSPLLVPLVPYVPS
jgi:hypothetical protein